MSIKGQALLRVLGSTLLYLTAAGNSLRAQSSEWVWSGQVNVGCHLNLTYDLFKSKIGKGQKFAGARLFAGLSLQGARGNFLINYGPSLSIYTKSIGANLNPLVGDIQIDFTNSFSVGGSWGSDLD